MTGAPNHLLRAAAASGNPAKAVARIDAGDDLEGRHKGTGRTPLLEAVIAGHADVVALLIDRGADLSAACTAVGHTALGWAVEQGNADIVGLLLDRGAGVDGVAPNSFLQRTPLHLAAQKGDVQILARLLEAGASLQAVDGRSDNALSLAREGGRSEAAAVLLATGAAEPERPLAPTPLPWPELDWDPCALGEGAELSDGAQPAQVVVSYIRALHAWEVEAWRLNHEASKEGRRFDLGAALVEAERLTRLHVTDKARKYRRASLGAIPDLTPDFALLEDTARSASRRELLVRHPAPGEFAHEYEWIFVCLRRAGRWRIEAARNRLRGTIEWKSTVL